MTKERVMSLDEIKEVELNIINSHIAKWISWCFSK